MMHSQYSLSALRKRLEVIQQMAPSSVTVLVWKDKATGKWTDGAHKDDTSAGVINQVQAERPNTTFYFILDHVGS